MLAGGLADRVMAEVERQFATHGLILKQGTIIDATVVSAAVHKPARVNQPSRLDPDAQWLSHGNGASNSATRPISVSIRAPA